MKTKDRVARATERSLDKASDAAAALPVRGAGRVAGSLDTVRTNDVPAVVVVVVAAAAFLAMVAAVGMAGAWAYYCAQQGLYPALEQPPIDQGGTWALRCVE